MFTNAGLATRIFPSRVVCGTPSITFSSRPRISTRCCAIILGGAQFDGNAGNLRHAQHEFMIARQGNAGLAPMTAKVPTTWPSETTMGVDHAAQTRARAASRRIPWSVGFDVGDDHQAAQYTAAEQEP